MPETMNDIYGDDGVTITQLGILSNQITACLVDVQNQCDFYQTGNIDRHPFCSTYFKCGATVISAPRGTPIERIYTLPREADCCPVYYDYIPDFDQWLVALEGLSPKWENPANTGLPALPNGFRFARISEASGTTDKGRRWDRGVWTLYNGNLYMAPRIESWEEVLIEWQGVKRSYSMADPVNLSGPFIDPTPDAGMELANVVVPFVKEYRGEVRDDARRSADGRVVSHGLPVEARHAPDRPRP